MMLPDSLFTRVLAALHPDERPAAAEAAAPDGERAWKRKATRRRVNRPVWYAWHQDPLNQRRPATLLDISKVGVGIVVNFVAAPGERIIVYLPCGAGAGAAGVPPEGPAAADGGGLVALLCTVRTCRVRTDGTFRLGAKFTEPNEVDTPAAAVISADGLLNVPGDGHFSADGSARRVERHDADGRATMYLYRGKTQAPLEHVPVADLSETGVAIFRGEPLDVGDEFVIRVPRLDEAPITRMCRVVNVVPSGGRYRVGAAFIPFSSRRGRSLFSRIYDWIA